MKQGRIELVFILDRSSSMSGLEKATIDGYNAMLEKQRAMDGECRITTVFFHHDYELFHDRIEMHAVRLITENDYRVGGATAFFDALGSTIHKMENVQKNTVVDYRAEKIMFVMITDGKNNASRKYSFPKVKKQIERQKTEYGWEFVFFGANLDAITVAREIGIASDRSVEYLADSKGTLLSFGVINEMVSAFRKRGSLDVEGFEPIHADVKKRRNKKK